MQNVAGQDYWPFGDTDIQPPFVLPIQLFPLGMFDDGKSTAQHIFGNPHQSLWICVYQIDPSVSVCLDHEPSAAESPCRAPL